MRIKYVQMWRESGKMIGRVSHMESRGFCKRTIDEKSLF